MFVAIGIPHDEFPQEFKLLEGRARRHDLMLTLLGANEVDSEVRGGVSDFGSAHSLSIMQFAKLSTAKESRSSSGVNDNLVEFFLGNAEPDLINFLIDSKDLLPAKYFLVFADEWRKDEPVIYKTLGVSRLKQYFSDNCSWQFWLYDYKRLEYTIDPYIPLILEVKNE